MSEAVAADKTAIISRMLEMAAEPAEQAPEPDAPAVAEPAADVQTDAEKPAAKPEQKPEDVAKGAEWRKVRDAQRSVKQREAQLSQREQELHQALADARKARALLAEGSPLEALDALGVDREALFRQISKLAEGHDPKVEALREQQRALQEKLDAKERAEQESAQREQQTAKERAAYQQVATALRASDDPVVRRALEVVGDRYERAVFAELRRAASEQDPAYDWADEAAVLREANSRVITNARTHHDQLVKLFAASGSGPVPAVAGSSRTRSAAGKPTQQTRPDRPLTPREAFLRGQRLAQEAGE